MLPRIGVYPYDPDLHYTLVDQYYSVSNRDLLYQLITEPLYDIREQATKNESNPYILREKHRKWVEYIREHLGDWVDLPSWEDLIQDPGDGCCFHGVSCCPCECLFTDGPEWILLGDDVDLAYGLIDRLHTPLLVSDNVVQVIEKLLEANPDMKDLIVISMDLEAIYVYRSRVIEGCGDLHHSPTGFHAFENLADCTEPGSIPTYVLEDSIVEHWARLTRENAG